MDVLVYSPHCTDEKAKKMGATKKDIEDLLKESDFVSLHIPHTKDSHYLLNDKTLGIMKTGAYLVNVARGGVVDENALFNALKESRLSGAAVDVFEQEPPSSNNKLLSLENVILSPHLGASTKEAQIQAGTVCADQMNIVLSGKDPDFWVNKKFM
jgi:D-3-phosphoglycerate dehydrogenase